MQPHATNLRTVLWCSLTLLAGILLSACGGGDTSEPAAAAPQSSADPRAVSQDNPCSVLLPSEVAEILGRASDLREIVDEETCHYHFDPGPDGMKTADGETFIEVKMHWVDGKMSVTAARMAAQLLDPGGDAFEKLPDVGDEAWLAPLAAYLAFTKGDVGVEIDMRMLPGERDKAVQLAQRIAGRI